MSLADTLEAISAKTLPGPQCSVKTFLATLNAHDRAELEETFARPSVKSRVIHEHILSTHEVFIGDQTIRKHRKGECKCLRTS